MTRAEPFDLSRITRETFVRDVEYHDVLGSTNDRALEILSLETFDAPFLVLADSQTSGRGRGSNAWWSPPGALAYSLIVDAPSHGLSAERQRLVSLAAGLSVCEALKDLLPNAILHLKWPNDVFLNGRKASGLLVEASGTRPGRMVVGIGINVNNSLQAAPMELRGIATSLVEAAGSPQDRTDVLIRVLQRFDAALQRLAASDSELLGRWREFCVLTGRTVLLRVGTQDALGRCQGIDDDGALVLETPDGISRFQSGVVVRYE